MKLVRPTFESILKRYDLAIPALAPVRRSVFVNSRGAELFVYRDRTGKVDPQMLNACMMDVLKAQDDLPHDLQLEAFTVLTDAMVEVLDEDGLLDEADKAKALLRDLVAATGELVDDEKRAEKSSMDEAMSHPLVLAAFKRFETEVVKLAAVICHDKPAALEKLAKLRPELFKRKEDEDPDEEDDDLEVPRGMDGSPLHRPNSGPREETPTMGVGGNAAPTAPGDEMFGDDYQRRTRDGFGFPNVHSTDPAWGNRGKKGTRGPRIMRAEEAAMVAELRKVFDLNSAAVERERLAIQKRLGFTEVEPPRGPRVVESVEGSDLRADPYAGVSKRRGPRIAEPVRKRRGRLM